MKHIIFFFITAIITLGLVSCSEKPSEDAAKTVEKSVKQEEKAPVQKEVSPKAAEPTTATKATTQANQFQVPADATEVKMKIKAKEKNGMVNAKISITHDMLTYDQAKKKGLEANFITHITARVGDRVVYDASTSQFLSKNPLVKFSFEGKKGEELTIIYSELKGQTYFAKKNIK